MSGGDRTTKDLELFRLVFEESAIGLSVTGLDGRIFPNQALADMVGYTRDELRGIRWQDLTHPEDVQAGVVALEKMCADPTVGLRIVKRYIHKSGRIVWAEVSSRLHREADGTPSYFLTSILDVTQRRQTEEELVLRNTILSTEHETLPEGILVVDARGQVLSHNRRFLEICGIPDAVVDRGDDQALLAEAEGQIADPASFRESTAAIYRSPFATSHDEIALKDGRIVDRSSAPMVTQRGENLGRLWCFREVTATKRAESALRDKLRELERWQDLMLDREERVVELKREVNELCRKLGEAARYPSQEPDATGDGCGPFKVTSGLPRVPEPGDSDGNDRE